MGLVSSGGGEGGITYEVIRELEAEDVCQVYHSLVFRVIDFGSSDICLDTIDLFIRPLNGRGVGVLKSETRMYKFTLSCALIANACKTIHY